MTDAKVDRSPAPSRGETTLEVDGQEASAWGRSETTTRLYALTIICHPDARRVGERHLLPVPHDGEVEVSRTTPTFMAPDADGQSLRAPRALDDPHLSRRPIVLGLGGRDGSISIRRNGSRSPVEVDGVELGQFLRLDANAIERGVPLVLGRTVALLLHVDSLDAVDQPAGDLLGAAPALRQLIREAHLAARLDVPVLLRGESGTGKELTARLIHEASARARGPYVAINLAAVPPTLAASELFGAAKGAFTGAGGGKDGFFQRANGGTLFLDEIGEVPGEVQPLLLRALENDEVQGVGHAGPRKVDVRVIAATDADLDARIEAGTFRPALLHRLSGYELRLPPLRERRADFGRLLYAFLRRELAATDGESLLEAPDANGRRWPDARLVARLMMQPWPGNVRQLKNVARRLAIARLAGIEPRLDPHLLGRPADRGPVAPAGPPSVSTAAPHGWRPAYRKPSDVEEEDLLDGLRAHNFELKATARALGLSRTSLYDLIDKHPLIRTASEIGAEEIRAALEAHGDVLESAAAALEVSPAALRQRLRSLDR